MAQNSTIFKLRIALSDLERNYYDTLKLTVALHPSETAERLVARVMAYCLNAEPGLVFGKGLCQTDEPDIWLRSVDDQTKLWIDVGEPAPERVKKATRWAKQVRIYSFNGKSDVWWQQGQSKFSMLDASFYRFDTDDISAIANSLARSMELSVTISGTSAYLVFDDMQRDLNWAVMQE